VLAGITQQYDSATKGAGNLEEAEKSSRSLYPNLLKEFGGDINEANKFHQRMMAGFRPKPTGMEALTERGLELLNKPAGPVNQPPGPAAQAGRTPALPPGPASRPYTPIDGASLMAGKAPVEQQSDYDKMALGYVNDMLGRGQKATQHVRITMPDGKEIDAIENPEEKDTSKRWTTLDGKSIKPDSQMHVNERAPHVESAAAETTDVVYGHYAEEHRLDKGKLTDSQKFAAKQEAAKAKVEASQIAQDPAGMDMLSSLFLMNPQVLGLLGGGIAGAQLRMKVIGDASKLKNVLGMTDQDIAANWMGFAANKSSLIRLQPQADMTDMLSSFVDKQLDRLESRAKDVGLSDNRYANRSINWFKQNMSGDPKISAYLQLVNAAQTEVASILGNRAMSSTLPEGARKDMQQFMSGDATYPQVQEMVKLLKIEKQNKQDALHQQITEIKDRVKNSIPEPDSIVFDQNDPLGLFPAQKKGGK
jgi:hypothetical protein